MDLARGLSTRLADAERIKTLHGSALLSLSDDQELVAIPPVGDDDRDLLNQVPQAALTRIIRPRIEEILEVVRDRIDASGFSGHVGKRVVMTGGASQMTGMAELRGEFCQEMCVWGAHWVWPGCLMWARGHPLRPLWAC